MGRIRHIFTAFLAIGLTAAAAEGRTWTDASGQFRVDGEFVSLAEGVVTIKKDAQTEMQVPLDKLSTDDQAFVAGLHVGSPAANPFVEVPKEDEHAKPIDLAAKTAAYLADFRARLEKRLDAEDTSEKRAAALKPFTDEFRDRPLVFRYVVKDVATNAKASTISVADHDAVAGFASRANSFELRLTKEQVSKIGGGDTLVVGGKGIFANPGTNPQLPRDAIQLFGAKVGHADAAYYGIWLRDVRFKFEPKAAAKK